MATIQYFTTSNTVKVSADAVEPLSEIIDDYVFGSGPFGVTEPEIQSYNNDDGHYLSIASHAPFAPVVRKDRFDGYDDDLDRDPDFHSDTRYEVNDAEEFLERVYEHINSELRIHTVAHTKLRDSHAELYAVTTDGTITTATTGTGSGLQTSSSQVGDANA